MKPLLVGMCNPYGDDADLALWPSPTNCAGWRVWQMLRRFHPNVTEIGYVRSFDRINLLSSDYCAKWDASAARSAAANLLPTFSGRSVVLFGNAVRDAFASVVDGLLSVQPADVMDVEVGGEATRLWFLPHPSGRCHWYNDNANARAAATILSDLFKLGLKRRELA